MKNLLLKLSEWLEQNGEEFESEQVEDLSEYAEPWHEEAVKEFGAEPVSEEDYLEQFREPSGISGIEYYGSFNFIPVYEGILKHEGFTPVSGSRKNPYLGAGEYGKVFRGIYQGKPAVAKVILNEDDYEAEKWELILKSSAQFSPELQKHIPKIYAIRRGSVDVERMLHRKFLNYAVIIMEELKPLDPRLLAIIKSQGQENKEAIKRMLKDEDFLWKAAQRIATDVTEYFKKYTGYVFDPLVIFKYLTQYHYQEMEDEERIDLDPLIEDIKKHYQKEFKLQGRELSKLEAVLTDYINIYLDPSYLEFPRSAKDQGGFFFENLPETREYMNALETLSEMGISWRDLHPKNMMMDANGNLKIIDVGLYEVAKSGKKEKKKLDTLRRQTSPTLTMRN